MARNSKEKVVKRIAIMLQEESTSKDESNDNYQSTCAETITECRPNHGFRFEETNDENYPKVNDEHEPDEKYEENEANFQLLEMNGDDFDQKAKINRSTRRRKRKEWKREELKRKVLCGEEHNSASGTKIPKKEPKPLLKHPGTCRTKCNEHFTETDRADICKKYWNIETINVNETGYVLFWRKKMYGLILLLPLRTRKLPSSRPTSF